MINMGSFGGGFVGGGTGLIGSGLLGVSSNNITSDAGFKLEGTSTTYGQNVIKASSNTTTTTTKSTSPNTTQLLAGGGQQTILSAIKENTPFTPSQNSAVVPKDTLVQVVQDSPFKPFNDAADGNLTNFQKSSIVGAAAAALKTDIDTAIATIPKVEDAVILPPPEMIIENNKIIDASPPIDESLEIQKKQQELFETFLGNFAKNLPQLIEYAIVKGSAIKTKEEINKAITEAQKVDLMVSLKSKSSESLEFNNLRIPTLKSEFVYNFFTEDEEDINIQEDPKKDPFLKDKSYNVPRYTVLKWDVIKVINPLTSTEKEAKMYEDLRIDAFDNPKGVTTTSDDSYINSVLSTLKKFDSFNIGGLKKQLADIHFLEEGFNAIANDKMFSNDVSTVVNTDSKENVIEEVPIKSVNSEDLSAAISKIKGIETPKFFETPQFFKEDIQPPIGGGFAGGLNIGGIAGNFNGGLKPGGFGGFGIL